MSRSLKEALENRRSYYQITNSSPIPDQQIREILEFGLKMGKKVSQAIWMSQLLIR